MVCSSKEIILRLRPKCIRTNGKLYYNDINAADIKACSSKQPFSWNDHIICVLLRIDFSFAVKNNLCHHLLPTSKKIWDNLMLSHTVYPKKYAHGFCFAVLCCGYTLTDFPISIRLTSLALWQSNDCPSASKATLMNMDKYFMWIHYERLHNHKQIYCMYTRSESSMQPRHAIMRSMSVLPCWAVHDAISRCLVIQSNFRILVQ